MKQVVTALKIWAVCALFFSRRTGGDGIEYESTDRDR